MPNFTSPSGLSPVGYINGSAWNGQARTYWIPSTDINAYAVGDPVASTPGADGNGVAQVTIGAAGVAIRGVMVGVSTLGSVGSPMSGKQTLSQDLVPAVKGGSDYYIRVVDDPQVIFEITEGGTGVSLTAAAVSLNANFLAATNNGFVSQYVLDNASTGTANTLNVKLLGLSPKSGNTFGPSALWLVLIMNHELI